MFAIYAAVDGVAALATAVDHGRAGLRWGWWLVEGLVSLAVAALALARPGITLLAIVLLIAFRAILLGLVELGGALGGKGLDHRWLLGLTGRRVPRVRGAAASRIRWRAPSRVVWVVGVYAVVFGVMLVVVGLRALGTRTTTTTSARASTRPVVPYLDPKALFLCVDLGGSPIETHVGRGFLVTRRL